MLSLSEAPIADPADDLQRVSSRLLSELWLALARHGIAPADLLGDLPIAVNERGLVKAPVHWDHFNVFLQRLEREVGGPDGLERCGEWVGRGHTSHVLRTLMALATSPFSLYRAVAIWGAQRAMPGVVVEVSAISANHLSIEVRVPDALGPCSAILHVTTGIFRTLPRQLGMPDAVVESQVEARRARYDITAPSSRTGWSRLRRFVRSLLTPGTVLRQLESRQLELRARHAALVRAHEAALASESRLRALSDASVDMLCELDEAGRIVFVSASVRELIGYSPEQVTGSHYRLWIPTPRHARATDLFEALRSAPIGTAIARQSIELHAAHGRRVVTEASVRSYLGVEGAWRAVASFREVTTKKAPQFAPAAASTQGPATETRDAHPPVKRPLLLDRLQAGVAGLRTRHAGHPIERSLAQLVALLETTHHGPLVDGADRADRLLEATQRMTRVVEHALISDRGEDEWKQWIETRKLVDRMRDRHAGRPEASALALQIDVSRGPAEIFGAEPLLEACVAGLIDWGIERDRLAPTRSITKSLLLSFETQAGAPDAGPSLQISVAWESTAGETSSSGAASATAAATRLTDGESSFEARTPQAIDAELTLAVVADATRLLGGELLGSLPAHQGHVRTIRLPQPAPVDTPANTPADYSI